MKKEEEGQGEGRESWRKEEGREWKKKGNGMQTAEDFRGIREKSKEEEVENSGKNREY